jgi:transcriptional regulator with XRE-family HTH domain
MTRQESISYGKQEEQDGKKGRAQEIDQHIGQRLRKLRKMRNLTQEDVADHLGVSFQQIQKYENGKNRLPFGRAYELSNFLGVDLDAFTTGAEKNMAAGFADGSEQQSLGQFNKDQTKRNLEELQKAYFSIQDAKRRTNFVKLAKDMARNMNE